MRQEQDISGEEIMKPGKLAPRFRTRSVPIQVRQQQPREGKLATFATSAIFLETWSFLGAEPDIWSHLHSSSCLTGTGSLCFFSCLRLGLFLPNLQQRYQKLLKVFLSHPSPMARDWNWKVLVAHPEGVPLIYSPSGSPPWRHRRSHTRRAPLRLQAP